MGLTNRQIGGQLYISHKTVEIHLCRACRKLECHGRAAAVAEAMRRGLIE
jgi:DNA-binding NarL/FixJ family response regulator